MTLQLIFHLIYIMLTDFKLGSFGLRKRVRALKIIVCSVVISKYGMWGLSQDVLSCLNYNMNSCAIPDNASFLKLSEK